MSRKLQRSRTNRLFMGVCGGIADYLDVDSAIVRIIFVAITLFTAIFPGIILYLACAFIMPREDDDTGTVDADYTEYDDR